MQTQEEIIIGSMIGHLLQMQKLKKDPDEMLSRYKRLKSRFIELDWLLLGTTAEDRKKHMTCEEAFDITYDRLPLGNFSGTQLSEKCRFLTGRPHAHNDSFIRVLRRKRFNGDINAPNYGDPKKSLYCKLELGETLPENYGKED